jgi:predicted dehydrogenase
MILSRRDFLASSAVGALAVPAWSADAAKPVPPSERLRVGMIGVSGQGKFNWTQLASAGAEIAAICDVDDRVTGEIRGKFPQATVTNDFRKLIDGKGLDAVCIATPDHTHAIIAATALVAGLHVYCEKPLTHSVSEARLLAQLAAKHNRVTQMGTQMHATSNYRRVVELVQANVVGPIREVHVWCGKSWGGGDRPADQPPVPMGLNFDLWLGPAPERPYHPTYVPFNWRKWWDFGGGTLADMACHYMDLPFWALNLKHPTTVKAEGPPAHAETAALKLTVTYEFPARGELPPVTLAWYDGGNRPQYFADGILPKWGDGVLFVGSKGMILANYSQYKLLPDKDFAGFTPPNKTIADSIGHHKEWIEACKANKPTTLCNFAYSGALTEAVLLGNVAYRCGQPLQWNAAKLEAVGTPQAEAFLRRAYRKGWTLPSV